MIQIPHNIRTWAPFVFFPKKPPLNHFHLHFVCGQDVEILPHPLPPPPKKKIIAWKIN